MPPRAIISRNERMNGRDCRRSAALRDPRQQRGPNGVTVLAAANTVTKKSEREREARRRDVPRDARAGKFGFLLSGGIITS